MAGLFAPVSRKVPVKISESFSYQFKDIQWPTKLGLGALLSLVPVLNFAIAGYEVAIIRNVTAAAREPLPQWDELGKKWWDGLILTLAGLVYAVPVFVVLALVLTLLAASGVFSQNASGSPVGVPSFVVLACFVLFLLVYSLLLSVIRPIILVLFSREGTFASCFRLGEIIRVIDRRPRVFFITWLVVIAAGLAIGLIVGFANLVVGWIPCVGWLAGLLLGLGTAMYLITVDGYIFGQFRLEAFEQAEPPRRPPTVPALPPRETQQNPGDLSS